MDDSLQDAIDFSAFTPPTCASLLLQFLKELPEPLTAHLHDQFLDALQHTSEALQVAELKALIRQLPELNRTVLMLILRTLNAVEHADHKAKHILANIFSPHIIWDADQDEFGPEQSQKKVKLVQLMLNKFFELAEAVPGGLKLRTRANRAGVVPDPLHGIALAGSALTHASPAPESDLKNLVSALPPMFDEGLAAVKQLSDSNEALNALVEHMEDSLSSLDTVVVEVGTLREKLTSIEQRHNALAQDVEDKISSGLSPTKGGNSAIDQESVAALEHKMEAWIQVVQTRLDNMEASHMDEEDRAAKGLDQREAEAMIEAALAKALQEKELAQQEAFSSWKKKMEDEFSSWKEKIMQDAAKVVASQIAESTKRVDARFLESDEKRAELAKSIPKTDLEELAKLKKRVDELGQAEERLNDRIDDLMRSVEDVSERMRTAESERGKPSDQLEPFQSQLLSVVKQQDAHGTELAELSALRSKVDALSQQKQQAPSSPSHGGADEGMREALESLRAEVGKAQGVRAELAAVEAQQAALREQVEELAGRMEQAPPGEAGGAPLSEVLEELDALRESSAADLVAVQARIDRVEAAHAALQGEHAATHASCGALVASVAAAQGELRRLAEAAEVARAGAGAGAERGGGGGRAVSESAGVEEAFGSLFAEHLAPEIASLREAVHALQVLIGKPSGSAGAPRARSVAVAVAVARLGRALPRTTAPRWCPGRPC